MFDSDKENAFQVCGPIRNWETNLWEPRKVCALWSLVEVNQLMQQMTIVALMEMWHAMTTIACHARWHPESRWGLRKNSAASCWVCFQPKGGHPNTAFHMWWWTKPIWIMRKILNISFFSLEIMKWLMCQLMMLWRQEPHTVKQSNDMSSSVHRKTFSCGKNNHLPCLILVVLHMSEMNSVWMTIFLAIVSGAAMVIDKALFGKWPFHLQFRSAVNHHFAVETSCLFQNPRTSPPKMRKIPSWENAHKTAI